MPTLDDKLNELVRDICSLDYIKTKSEMRRRIMEVATAYARSIVPAEVEEKGDYGDCRCGGCCEVAFNRCRTEIINKIYDPRNQPIPNRSLDTNDSLIHC